MVEYYENKKGEVAVLVSGGYGAGWSTWAYDYGINLAIDKRIVEYFLAHRNNKQWLKDIDSYDENEAKKEMKTFLKNLGYEGVYLGGFADIHIEWVKKGVPFRINEYDGFETLEVGTDSFIVL